MDVFDSDPVADALLHHRVRVELRERQDVGATVAVGSLKSLSRRHLAQHTFGGNLGSWSWPGLSDLIPEVLRCEVSVGRHSVGEVEDAGRTHIFHLVLTHEVIQRVPVGLDCGVQVGLCQVKRVRVSVDWHHEFFVPVNDSKRWVSEAV